MDDLDGKLMDERTRLADLLRGLGATLDGLSLERAADVLPHVSGAIDELVRYARALGLPVSTPYRTTNDLSGQTTGPLDRRSLVREDVAG